MWPFNGWRIDALEHTTSAHGRKIDDLYKRILALQKNELKVVQAAKELKGSTDQLAAAVSANSPKGQGN